MKTEKKFKPLAMKCTQEDWDSIQGLFTGQNIFNVDVYNFIVHPYLVNNGNNKENYIRNYQKSDMNHASGRIFYETFNAKIFLEACGIETKPTLEEVKERFKDAEIVLSIYNNEFIIGEIKEFEDEYEASELEKENSYHTIWNKEHGYAKILTYKTPKFEITKEQILSLHHHGHDLTKTQLGDIFPEVFEKELEVESNKWYSIKWRDGDSDLFYCYENNNGKIIHKDLYFRNGQNLYVALDIYLSLSMLQKDDRRTLSEATPQEVEAALIGEWKRLGGKVGVLIYSKWAGHCTLNKNKPYLKNNELWFGDCRVFVDGKFATIIETITIREAEKLLNKKKL